MAQVEAAVSGRPSRSADVSSSGDGPRDVSDNSRGADVNAPGSLHGDEALDLVLEVLRVRCSAVVFCRPNLLRM